MNANFDREIRKIELKIPQHILDEKEEIALELSLYKWMLLFLIILILVMCLG